MKVLTLCDYCGCKLQVTTDKSKEETTFMCPSCNKVNYLDLFKIITKTSSTTATTDIVFTGNAISSNKKPVMTEQLALEQLKAFCIEGDQYLLPSIP